jgi:CRP-like cAMP-binding protein
MAAHTKVWYLERFRLLDVLSDAQKRDVESKTRMLDARRGQHIYVPGDPSDQVFLLKSGVVRISALTANQEERILAFL